MEIQRWLRNALQRHLYGKEMGLEMVWLEIFTRRSGKVAGCAASRMVEIAHGSAGVLVSVYEAANVSWFDNMMLAMFTSVFVFRFRHVDGQ